MYVNIMNNPDLCAEIEAQARIIETQSSSLISNRDHQIAVEMIEAMGSLVDLFQGMKGHRIASINLVDCPDSHLNKIHIEAQTVANNAGYLKNSPDPGPIFNPNVMEKKNSLIHGFQSLLGMFEGYKA